MLEYLNISLLIGFYVMHFDVASDNNFQNYIHVKTVKIRRQTSLRHHPPHQRSSQDQIAHQIPGCYHHRL